MIFIWRRITWKIRKLKRDTSDYYVVLGIPRFDKNLIPHMHVLFSCPDDALEVSFCNYEDPFSFHELAEAMYCESYMEAVATFRRGVLMARGPLADT